MTFYSIYCAVVPNKYAIGIVFVWAWIIMRMTLVELLAIAFVSTCILNETIITHYKVKPETLKTIETKLNFITSKLSSKLFSPLDNSKDYISVDQALQNAE